MTTAIRLLVRFNENVYRTAKMVRINYSKKDYFYIKWDVEIKSEFNGTIQKDLAYMEYCRS
jgi:hypothetical protein